MVEVIRSGKADVVLGSRFLNPGGARAGGMPWWKRLANRFLTGYENRVLGLGLSEYHTGYRAYSRKFLTTVPFLRNSNDFVFDTQILTQAASFDFTVAEVPVTTRYFDDASSVNFRVSLVYGLKTVWTVNRYVLAPPRSAVAPLLALSSTSNGVHRDRRASPRRSSKRRDHRGRKGERHRQADSDTGLDPAGAVLLEPRLRPAQDVIEQVRRQARGGSRPSARS